MAGKDAETILIQGIRDGSHFTVIGVVRTLCHYAPNHQPVIGQLDEVDKALEQVIGDLQHVRDHIERQRLSD